MELHLVFLVLLAAVVHASWNAVVKAAGDRIMTFGSIHFVGTLLGAAAAFLVPLPEPQVWPYLLASAVIHNFYYVFLLLSYRLGDLSEVYPIARGTSPLLVAVGAAVVAGEVPTPLGMAGILLVSLGIISLAFSRAFKKERGGTTGMMPLAAAVTTGVLIACYTVVDGLGMRAGTSPWPYIVWLNLLEGIPFGIFIALTRARQVPAFLVGNWRPVVIGGTLTIVAYAIALYALTQGGMAHVSALRETSVLFAALIGTYLLKEGFGRIRILAAVVIASGIVILQLAG